ncbi:ATP-binding cassette domain-containing protein [Modestobacter sp. Leaf380]|uniref:ATP-binding cassette domain-containing protein n=1 Tax=Modestobacter sp. Leaf380 TaxID=1736356 RepID=UPI0006FE30E6|nr:ATP-binding cassette domain-containing protein [Modestobacter sp. Leaf380]KQS66138.1 ABC transporter [Modestobacter sp. Leaf380]
MALLQVDGLVKTFGARRVLQGVSFALDGGEVVGLVGANGAGKSTLGDVVAGTTPPDGGSMTLDGRPYAPLSPDDARHLGVGVVEQLVRIDPQLTVAQALARGGDAAGLSERVLRDRARAVLAEVGLELDPDLLVGDLPRFVHGLVETARVLAEDTRLVVLDEVSAALTPTEVLALHAVARRLREQGRGVLYISHRLPEMLEVVDRVLVLREGVIAADSPARDLDPARLAAATLAPAPLTPAPAVPARPVAAPVGPGAVVPSPRPPAEAAPRLDRRPPRPAGDRAVALSVRGLRVPDRVDGVDLELHRGEVLGLTGDRASGVLELVGALSGAVPASADEVRLRGRRHTGSPMLPVYSPDEDAYGVDPGETIARTLVDEPWGRPTDLTTEIASLRGVIKTVHQLHVNTGSIRTVFGALSGGDQHKLALARWLAAAGDVVVVQEPTRGLDQRSRREVRALLDEATARGTAVLVLSVDPDELAECCDRVGVLADGRVVEWVDVADTDPAGLRDRVLRQAARA